MIIWSSFHQLFVDSGRVETFGNFGPQSGTDEKMVMDDVVLPESSLISESFMVTYVQ